MERVDTGPSFTCRANDQAFCRKCMLTYLTINGCRACELHQRVPCPGSECAHVLTTQGIPASWR